MKIISKKDSKKIRKIYLIMQILIFVVMYLMYFTSYLGRKSLCIGFNGKNGAQSILNLPANTYAILGMIYYAAYMVGKSFGGVIADKFNIRITLPLAVFASSFFSAGIAIAGYLNKFSVLTSPEAVSMFMYITWGISAFIQSVIFPMCTKALIYWYSNKNRSYIWACFGTSAEFGSACSLILSGFLLQFYSWEYVFMIPAILGALSSILGFLVIRDNPTKLGLPDVESYKNGESKEGQNECMGDNCDDKNVDEKTYKELFISDVLKNKAVWFLSLVYICVYILRAGTIDWIPKMFMESGNTSPLVASLPAVILTISGIIGTLSISFISEKVFKERRTPAIICYLLVTTVCLIVFKLIFPFNGKALIRVPEPFYTAILLILMALSGIGIYGPQMMVGGIAAIETGSKKVASTILGITGSIGYLGSILSSFFGVFSNIYGYKFLTNTWIISGLIGIILMLPMWNIKKSKDYAAN